MKLNKDYTNFIAEIKKVCKEVHTSYLMRYALGVEASCYNYTPQVAINANNEEEIIQILSLARKFQTPVSFRAAGTSLSGQASCDSVLVIANSHFKNIKLNDNASEIECDCGVIGADANEVLAKFSRKIGPDPATISSALIGGIFNNNSSGMCCGVEENSYNTISSVRVILTDGSILDTGDAASLENFIKTHKSLCDEILSLREEILKDKDLVKLIKHKFKIKNTTGYSINSLVDFDNLRDILNHIFIGSEGTLGFVSKVRYKSVKDFKFKGCALLFFKDLDETSKAVVLLAKMGRKLVNAAEMMDYACLKAVKDYDGVPKIVSECKSGYTCILLQSVSDSEEELDANLALIKEKLSKLDMAFKPLFSKDEKETQGWWKIRKGLLPIAAGVRPLNTSVITEDLCFHIEDFCEGAKFIAELFEKYNFDGIIFGHALSGNLHFIITPNLHDEKEYNAFCELVKEMSKKVANMQGSIKAEHGTGRMVAPFVELEWGKKAYEINVKIKELFDKDYLLNPDVIITKDSEIYKKNLKEMTNIQGLPLEAEMINKCIECGFCEKHCPSREITLTPRQRISVLREIVRLKNIGEEVRANELLSEYEYYSVSTCATCSRCENLCPLNIDTAKIALDLRKSLKAKNEKFARKIHNNFEKSLNLAKNGVKFYHSLSRVFGSENLSKASKMARKLSPSFPFVPLKMPLANDFVYQNKDSFDEKIIYFSACTNRLFKPNLSENFLNDFNYTPKSLQSAVENLCKKAEISVLYPNEMSSLCCGKMFADYENLHKENLEKLNEILLKITQNGKIKIIVDHSSCFYELFKNLDPALKVLDLSEFLLEISPKLNIKKTQKSILVHKLCLLKKANKGDFIESLARVCAENVSVIKSFECCGFAGDKGFFVPELNQSSTKNLEKEARGYDLGVSSSGTCEIGLNSYSNLEFVNIAFLLDALS